ncbi:PREDICTED: uncharacterized protein LOC108373393 [Rhagoletis zephyria]|uniref:uncharacterized protein LOC108373393 n=1 Tax=Rhagoletis zephyria TaxID=28612 RepID=UPI000811A4BA|nr:PREDICTED: uncharacterized protein LOC108373393 [Rhagoletis zephyria]
MWRQAKQLCNIKQFIVTKHPQELGYVKLFPILRISPPHNEMKRYRREYKAAVNLLARSCSMSPCIFRQLHFSSKDFTPKKSDHKQGSAGKNGRQNSNQNDEKGNDNEQKVKSLLTKALLWMFTVYMFVVFLSLITSPRAERPEVKILKMRKMRSIVNLI